MSYTVFKNTPNKPAVSSKPFIDTAKTTLVTIGENKLLYVQVPKPSSQAIHFTADDEVRIGTEIKEAFQEAFPNTKVLVGFYDLQFSEITEKQAFEAKLRGKIV